jgi:hypothetical protein
MPDFKGTDDIIVQPQDVKVPYKFYFSTCTSESANDGSIPYGTTVSAVSVSAHTQDGTAETHLINSSGLSSSTVTLYLDYPTTGNGPGIYHITFKVTLNTTAILEFDFNRVYCKDL